MLICGMSEALPLRITFPVTPAPPLSAGAGRGAGDSALAKVFAGGLLASAFTSDAGRGAGISALALAGCVAGAAGFTSADFFSAGFAAGVSDDVLVAGAAA